MACMEHWCKECGKPVFNNEANGPDKCPNCGAERPDWRSYSDE